MKPQASGINFNFNSCFQKYESDKPNMKDEISIKSKCFNNIHELYSNEKFQEIRTLGGFNKHSNKIFALKQPSMVKRYYDIESEVKHFQKFVVPFHTSTYPFSLRSPFVGFKSNRLPSEIINRTFNFDNKLIHKFDMNDRNGNKEELLNDKNLNIREEIQDKSIIIIDKPSKSDSHNNCSLQNKNFLYFSEQPEENKKENLSDSDSRSEEFPQNNYSERKDVVCKSIFRAIKKHYLNEFKAYCGTHSIVINKKNKKDAFDKICAFTKTLFDESKISTDFEGIDTILIAKYISLISLPDHVIKTLGEYKISKEVKLFYECIYNYSKSKVNVLLQSVQIQQMISHFISSGGLLKMVENDKNLQRHKEIVFKRAKELFRSFIKTNL